MDRLARNLDDLRALVREFTGRGVQITVIKEGLTFNGEDDFPMATLLLSVMGAFAEFERALIRERQAEGIASSQATRRLPGTEAGSHPRTSLSYCSAPTPANP